MRLRVTMRLGLDRLQHTKYQDRKNQGYTNTKIANTKVIPIPIPRICQWPLWPIGNSFEVPKVEPNYKNNSSILISLFNLKLASWKSYKNSCWNLLIKEACIFFIQAQPEDILNLLKLRSWPVGLVKFNVKKTGNGCFKNIQYSAQKH